MDSMGGTRLDLTTIEEMEAEARADADGYCNKRIRGQWLEVKYIKGYRARYPFTYQWGRNMVSRQDAKEIIQTA